MDAKPEPVSKLQHFENEVAVAGHVLHDLPGAIWSGVADDFKANPVKKTAEVATAAAVSALLYIGTRRAPIITRDASVVGGVGAGALGAASMWQEAEKLYDGTKSLIADGWNAGDDATRNKLGHEYSAAIGKNVAPLAEASVGAALGVGSGHALLSAERSNAWLTANLTEKAEYSWRRRSLNSENSLLSKSGSFNGHSAFMNADGTANLLNVDEAIGTGPRTLLNRALRSVDPHIEEIRTIALDSNRVSAPIRGALHSSELGFNPKNITFHTHPDFVGARPSVSDVTRFGGVQMLRSGDDLAVYLGNTGKYMGVPGHLSIDQIFAERGKPTLQALIVNTREQTARVIEGTAVRNPLAHTEAALENAWQWSRSVPQYVDYKASTELLAKSHVNDPELFASHLSRLTEKTSAPPSDPYREMEDMQKLGGAAF